MFRTYTVGVAFGSLRKTRCGDMFVEYRVIYIPG